MAIVRSWHPSWVEPDWVPPPPTKILAKPVTVSKRTTTMNPCFTKSKTSDDRHVQCIRHKHGRRSYIAVIVGSRLELEHTRFKERDREREREREMGQLSYNIITHIYPVINHPTYADDLGITHGIEYNSVKSNVIILCCNKVKDIHIPNIVFRMYY